MMTDFTSSKRTVNGLLEAATAPVRPAGLLVVDDGVTLRNSIVEALSQRGFSVWAAADGATGIALYEQFQSSIDLVVCDLTMPGLDGQQTVEALRAISPSVRFCFMTGDWRAGTFNSLLKQGALRVFMKPFPSVPELADEIWTLIHHDRLSFRHRNTVPAVQGPALAGELKDNNGRRKGPH